MQSVDASVEGLGRADSIAGDIGAGGLTGELAARADDTLTEAQATAAAGEGAEDPVVVLGSGNLGLVYLRGDRRRTLEELDGAWPGLVSGLAGHPGIAFVGGVDADGVPWAIGDDGPSRPRYRRRRGHRPAGASSVRTRRVCCDARC